MPVFPKMPGMALKPYNTINQYRHPAERPPMLTDEKQALH
jgi:hypothetical protein